MTCAPLEGSIASKQIRETNHQLRCRDHLLLYEHIYMVMTQRRELLVWADHVEK